MSIPMESWLTAAAAVSATALGLYSYVKTARLRETIYNENLHRVELDKTREAFEAELAKLHEQLYRDRGRWDELNHLVIDSTRTKDKTDFKPSSYWGRGASEFLFNMGINPESIEVDPTSVFILTPFDRANYFEYDTIAKTCIDAGLRPTRGDETKIDGPILPFIIQGIVKSNLVIANINGRNANVFYELGIAQALGKETLIVSRKYDGDVPFDLRQQQIILYGTDTELRENLLLALNRTSRSSIIRSFDYDHKSETLRVEFVSGRIYAYRPVPTEIYEQFRAANSKGAFFDSQIRDHFPFVRNS